MARTGIFPSGEHEDNEIETDSVNERDDLIIRLRLGHHTPCSCDEVGFEDNA